MLAVDLVISSSETTQAQLKDSFSPGGNLEALDFRLVIVICARYMQGSGKPSQLLATREGTNY